eukprot:m.76748 g.76748  ORF g.76748 m.76748 type:complete len:254 (-) comp7891_c0_seq2:17-778(-)
MRGPHVRAGGARWCARARRPQRRQPCHVMHFCPDCRLFTCNITPAGLAALLAGVRASPSRLELLFLDHNPLGDEGATMLADWLATSPALQSLQLRDCNITVAGLAALLAGVCASPSRLEALCLSDNPLGDEGAAMLSDWLATSPPLQTLWLSCCGITDAGADRLLAAIRVNDLLTKLHLRNLLSVDPTSGALNTVTPSHLDAIKDALADQTGRAARRAALQSVAQVVLPPPSIPASLASANCGNDAEIAEASL